MKQLITEITINAPADKVWGILMNTQEYPKWNPFILSVDKEFKAGEKMNILLRQNESKKMNIKPVCIEVNKDKKLSWKGSMGMKGIFDGHHIFELESKDENTTRFIHREEFSGILVNLFWKQLDTHTRDGFEMMNAKLKELAEVH